MKHRMRFILLLLSGIPFSLLAQQYDPPSNDKEFEAQYQERIKKDHLNGIYIPKNLDDALAQLDKLTSPESKKLYMDIPEDTVCMLMHNRLGQWMIVNWSFYEGSRLSNYLHSAGVTYPDDMADFLLLAFHRYLHQKPVSIKELAVYFKDYRKQEWEKEIRKGKVLKVETHQLPKPPETGAAPAAPKQNSAPKNLPAEPPTPKG